MNENLLKLALSRKNSKRPPVWFMRQAGRYHAHYQNLRKRYSFIDLCKRPEVACEATMGPIEDFDFDAAILFSDLLFPLEAMGMGLRYEEGPKLDWHLKTPQDLRRLKGGKELVSELAFQAEAIELIRKKLAPEKSLLGFVGAPLTLFFYAVEGSHQGELTSAKTGLIDGRFDGFNQLLCDLLAHNMALQAKAGADAIAVMDTCAGEVAPEIYGKVAVPAIQAVLSQFKTICPDTPVIYYSKGTDREHWKHLYSLPIDGIGVDWRTPIEEVLRDWSTRFAVQGNIDPNWLFLPAPELEARLRERFRKVLELPSEMRSSWVCGLGHGVLPKTPEDNVRLFLKIQKEMFS